VVCEKARREVGALADAAVDQDVPRNRQLAVTLAHHRERHVDGSRKVAAGELVRLAHVDQQRVAVLQPLPLGNRHVAVQHVLREHARQVDRILCGTELWGVA